MIQSNSPVLAHDFASVSTTTTTTTPPSSFQTTSLNILKSPSLIPKSSDDVVDILNSRKLLRPVPNSSDALTPRKRALARKSSSTTTSTNSHNNNHDLFSPPSNGSLDLGKAPNISTVENEIDFEDDPEARISLFQFSKARILSFEELSETMEDTDTSQGRLLGHGKFEIYQLHQKRVSYLQCGSVVYPILPRLKVLKIAFNQFIIPLSNPERYWRIIIETEDHDKIKDLESALKSICHFRNLYINNNNDSKKKPEPEPESHSQQVLSHTKEIMKAESVKAEQIDIKSNSSLTSITTAVACFALESDTSTYVEDPVILSNPPNKRSYRADSNASSLDLELDEFFQEPESTQYYTAYPLFDITNETHDTITLTPPTFTNTSTYLNQSSIISVPKTRSRSSRSTSLYQSETSWMDPEDFPINSSTPTTQRYISLNLNPNTKFGHREKKEKRVITEPLFNLKTTRPKANTNLRYSSYDVFNILKEQESEKEEKDPGFKGFIQSFFG